MTSDIPKKLITIKEAAARSGLSTKTFSNYISEGILKRFGPRGRVLIDEAEFTDKIILGHFTRPKKPKKTA